MLVRCQLPGNFPLAWNSTRIDVESEPPFPVFHRWRDRVKMLQFVGDEMIIVYKRLESARSN